MGRVFGFDVSGFKEVRPIMGLPHAGTCGHVELAPIP